MPMYWGIFLAAAALAVVYLILCLRAELPKKGTLEWIDLYDKPGWHFPEAKNAFEGFDLLWCLIPGVLAGVLWCLVSWDQAQTAVGGAVVLWMVAPSFLAASCAYLLLRLMGCGFAPSLCASLLLLSLATLPLFLMPAAGILLLLWIWVKCGYGFPSWLCLTGVGLLLALGQISTQPYVLLLLPILVILIVAVIRRARDGECSLWRILPTILFVPAVFLLAKGIADAVSLGVGFSAPFTDGWYWTYFFNGLLPEFSLGEAWRLPQLLWFDLPYAMILLAGIPLLLVGAVRRRDRAALYLLLWDLAAVALWLTTYLELLPVVSAATCGWYVERMFRRKHAALAIVGLSVPVSFSVALTILHFLDFGGMIP